MRADARKSGGSAQRVAVGQVASYELAEHGKALLQCYSDALPFLGRSLLGDALYAAVLFGAYKLARHLVAVRFLQEEPLRPSTTRLLDADAR